MARKKKAEQSTPQDHPAIDHIHEQLLPLAQPIEQFILDPANVRKRTNENAEAIRNSLREFGQRKPIIVQAGTNTILAGNGTYEAAKALGWTKIAALIVSDDEIKARKFAIVDNRTAELSEWDRTGLLEQLNSLADMNEKELGFTESDLADLQEYRDKPYEMERIDIEQLKPHPRNYQQHANDQIAHIIKSIELHGFYRNIVVAKDNTILAGHGVVQAAQKMGRQRIPIIRLDIDPDDPRAFKVMTSDNEINNLATVDDRALTELLKDIMGSELGLDGTGFNEEQLAALTFITRPESEIKDKKAAVDWVGMPEFTPLDSPPKIIINFADEKARDEFFTKYDIKVSKKDSKTWTTWYPYREREDPASIKFVQKDA